MIQHRICLFAVGDLTDANRSYRTRQRERSPSAQPDESSTSSDGSCSGTPMAKRRQNSAISPIKNDPPIKTKSTDAVNTLPIKTKSTAVEYVWGTRTGDGTKDRQGKGGHEKKKAKKVEDGTFDEKSVDDFDGNGRVGHALRTEESDKSQQQRRYLKTQKG